MISISFTGILFTPYIEPQENIISIFAELFFVSGGFFTQLIFTFLCLVLFLNRKSFNSIFDRIIIIQILLNTASFISYLLIDLFFLKMGDFYKLFRYFPLFFYLLITLIEILVVYEICIFKKFWSEKKIWN